VTLCTLGVGATFGESVLNDSPRESTVVTRSTCELLRIERKDFKLIWEVSVTRSLPQHCTFARFHGNAIDLREHDYNTRVRIGQEIGLRRILCSLF